MKIKNFEAFFDAVTWADKDTKTNLRCDNVMPIDDLGLFLGLCKDCEVSVKISGGVVFEPDGTSYHVTVYEWELFENVFVYQTTAPFSKILERFKYYGVEFALEV